MSNEVSRIQLPNGEVYNIKDAELRKRIKAFIGDVEDTEGEDE